MPYKVNTVVQSAAVFVCLNFLCFINVIRIWCFHKVYCIE